MHCPLIEHSLDVMRCSDWIIYLGSEGSDKGGEIVPTGTSEKLAELPGSYTACYFK